MWSSVVLVLVFVCAGVRAQFASSFTSSFSSSSTIGGQGACFNTQTGFTTTNARPYTYNMEPLRSDFDIVIPEFPGCQKVGVSVSVCENGGASTNVQLMNNSHAYVRRTGIINTPGRADIVVYCAN